MTSSVITIVVSGVVSIATILLGANPILSRLQRNKLSTETTKTSAEARLTDSQRDVLISDGALRRIDNLEAALERADIKSSHCENEIDQLRQYVELLRMEFRRRTGEEPPPMPTPLPAPKLRPAT